MIDCQIVIGSAKRKRAADNFMDQTTRFACVPDLTSAYLSFNLAEPTEFKVVVDDIDIHKETLPEGAHERSLAHILTTGAIEPTTEHGIWTRHRSSFVAQRQQKKTSDYPRLFKVVFRRSDGSDQVVATFEFALLDDRSFVQQFERYDASHRPRQPKLIKASGGCSEDSTCCDNCGGYLPKDRTTCRNCGEPRKTGTTSKRSLF